MTTTYWEELGGKVFSKKIGDSTFYGLRAGSRVLLEPYYKSISEPCGEINFCTGVFSIIKDLNGRCSIFIIKKVPIESSETKIIPVNEDNPKIVTAEYIGGGKFVLKNIYDLPVMTIPLIFY